MIQRLSISVLLIGLLIACVDQVDLPIRQTERRLVVEGLVTDGPFPWVRLTYTGRYTSANPAPPELVVNDALVVIRDDQGRSVRLVPDPFAPAYYSLRDSTFTGQVGRSYILSVTLPDGTSYESRTERLNPVPVLDPLRARYRRRLDYLRQPDVYDILIDTQDPPTPENYYRWSALAYGRRWVRFDPQNPPPSVFVTDDCACSCWVPTYGPPGDVLSDALVNGNRISGRVVLSAPIQAVGAQYVQVQQFSLTRAAYQYWTLFEQQRTRSGSLFDAQPASIEGNVRAVKDTTIRALGFFGASAVSQQRLTIPGDTINYNRFLVRYGKQFIPPTGNCFSNFSNPILVPPSGWPAR
ncbi:DUF4249 domain-containing protein [Fibrisoma montanum]|uniref:DUF4249 domain-containing protein n=2 Tax=Fibrisoma montanum TaxID=2305895 RepID=A0A418M0M9_9BACT|nr:DUF4249 domain-containing protein [Fibrisoma montanum]